MSRQWHAYEKKWTVTKRAHRCDGCQRTWPAETQMWFVRGRWRSRKGLSDPYYIWLCPVCAEFARGWKDRALSRLTINLQIDARRPWWALWSEPYIKTEAAYGLEVLAAGLDPASLLVKKAGCHAEGTSS